MSQHGEEQIIDQCLEALGITEPGYAVEVGAAAGGNLSNTLQLERRNWTVLCIEPCPFYWPMLKERRKLAYPVACAAEHQDWADFTVMQQANNESAFEAGSALKPRYDLLSVVGGASALSGPRTVVPVRVETLDWCLERAGFPRCDVASIDVEGGEIDVLRGFSLDRWKPAVMVVENWLAEPPLREYLRERGYGLMMRLGVNDFFIPQEAMDGPAGSAGRTSTAAVGRTLR